MGRALSFTDKRRSDMFYVTEFHRKTRFFNVALEWALAARLNRDNSPLAFVGEAVLDRTESTIHQDERKGRFMSRSQERPLFPCIPCIPTILSCLSRPIEELQHVVVGQVLLCCSISPLHTPLPLQWDTLIISKTNKTTMLQCP